MKYNPSLSHLYYDLLENFHGSIVAVDPKGTIVYANRHIMEIKLPTLNSEMIGMQMEDLVKNGFIDTSATLEVLKTQQQTIKSINILNDAGDHLPVMTVSTPLFNSDGEMYLVSAVSLEELDTRNLILKIEEEKNQIRQVIKYLRDKPLDFSFIAESPSMKEIISLASRVAKSDSPVMIYGESGTGKEVLSRFIYENSGRKQQPFIPVNCASIPPALMESEFFGYDKGSFTGASSGGKPGLFELSNNGTLLLDEVGELPLSLQSALLRVIENGEVRRIGSSSIIKTDSRIIAATNRNLESMVERGEFRRDLFYRLNVLPITVPPLRERQEDIEALASVFLNHYNRKYNTKKVFASGAMDNMIAYSWPGNVRELKNIINRMIITSKSDNLYFNHVNLNKSSMQPYSKDTMNCDFSQPLKKSVQGFERKYIISALKETEGNIALAANKLGIHKSNLYKKILEYGIDISTKNI